MISCERFENYFEAWQENRLNSEDGQAMHLHASQCAHCAKLELETVQLRGMLTGCLQYEPSPGFEFRLQRRISEEKNGELIQHSRKSAVLPRWAAMGAGLATGVAIGVAFLIPTDPGSSSSNQLAIETSGSTLKSNNQQLVATMVDSIKDTSDVNEDPYNINKHSRMVSTDR